jgi:topoisomerase-4 subunit A
MEAINNRKQNFASENPDSRLFLLTDEAYPRIEVVFGGKDSGREPLIIDVETFIGVKSFKTKGKRISSYEIQTINELEPVRLPAEPAVAEPEPEKEVTRKEPEPVKSNSDLIDEITGQMKLFDE